MDKQSLIARKWHSARSSRWRRLLLRSVGIVVFTLLVLYNYFTSELYLRQLGEKVTKRQPERARCCQSADVQLDMCGRSDCLWPCPSPKAKDYDDLIAGSVNRAFFHETSGRSSLNFRQACTVESLANVNPDLTVYVLMTGQVDSDAITMRTLTENYANIKIVSIDLGDYLAGTRLDKWYFCSDWNRGWFAVSHLSDALRFLTLSKFGGYYFDLDMIQRRPVTSLKNFVVEEGTGKLGSSVIHSDRDHPFIRASIEEFRNDYKWYVWAHVGPDLITRVLQRLCNDYDISWMTPERCQGFRVLPAETFYPVHWMNWREYFHPRQQGDTSTEQWGDDVIGAHVWNSKSSEFKVDKHSNQYYTQLARKSCPRLLDVAPEEF